MIYSIQNLNLLSLYSLIHQCLYKGLQISFIRILFNILIILLLGLSSIAMAYSFTKKQFKSLIELFNTFLALALSLSDLPSDLSSAPLPTLPSTPPSAPLPIAPPAPPAPKLPPQLIPPPIPTRSYPSSPSIEALEEVEYIQIKKLLQNIKKQLIR